MRKLGLKVGDLVTYTDVDADLGIGVVTDLRKHGGWWAYFPRINDYFVITKEACWKKIS